MDSDGKMFKRALKETDCQEQFSNQRGNKKIQSLFHFNPENMSSCGEMVLKWAHQLKWEKVLTVQHEKGL